MERENDFKMDVFAKSLIHILFYIRFFSSFRCATIQDTNAIRELILTNYSRETLPVSDQSSTLYLNVTIYLRSIIELNEPKGELTTTMGINYLWNDDSLTWDGLKYGNQYMIRVEKERIWTPNVVLSNPGSGYENEAPTEQKMTVTAQGAVIMTGGNMINTVCAVDVTYFPFDVQVCDLIFQTWEYGPQVRFRPTMPKMDLSNFIENGVWSLSKTEVEASTDNTGYVSFLRTTVYLERRALYYSMNFLAPILILVFLNSMVFLLPAESGERVGFAVTILLSIAVYMTIISDRLPQTSNPISLLSYVLIAYLVQSTSICIETVASLRFFHRDDSKPVGAAWRSYTTCIRCSSCKCDSDLSQGVAKKYDLEEINSNQMENNGSAKNNNASTVHCEKFTWTKVSKSLDVFFLFFNLLGMVVIATTYFVIAATRQKI